MPADWMPTATRYARAGGRMNGGSVRAVVWHTSESSPDADPMAIARYVAQRGSEYHVIWNPRSGKMVQLIPAGQSARALANNGSMQTNRTGRVRIQICVVGRVADNPLKNSPMKGWSALRAWLASWGVPETDARDWTRSATTWTTRSGHTDHKSCPGNNHHDTADFGALFHTVPVRQEERDMFIIRQGTKSPILVFGSATMVIDEKSAASIQKALDAGRHSAKITADDYQRFKSL